MTDVPRCRRCRRPLTTDATDRGGLGQGCWRIVRRRRRRLARQGFPGIRAYRAYGHVPGQTVIPIDERIRP